MYFHTILVINTATLILPKYLVSGDFGRGSGSRVTLLQVASHSAYISASTRLCSSNYSTECLGVYRYFIV